jgi:hypothetical protein
MYEKLNTWGIPDKIENILGCLSGAQMGLFRQTILN